MTIRPVWKACGAMMALGVPCAIGCVLAVTAVRTKDYFDKYVDSVRQLGFEERRVTVREGVELNIAEGPKAGIPLLLIPGQGSVWQEYAKALTRLIDTYHVVVVDVHGHGSSTWNAMDYTAKTIAADLAVLLRSVFGQVPAVLAGHSSGGLIAARIAAEYPDQIRAVLFEDAPFFATEPERVPHTYVGVDNYPSVRSFLQQGEETDWVCWYMPRSYWRGVFGGLWDYLTRQVTKQRRAHPGRLPVIRWLPVSMNRIWESMSHPFDLEFSAAFADNSWFAGFDQEATLAAVSCPTMFLKATTRYADDGLLLAALNDEDLQRVDDVLKDNVTVRIEGPHDLHFAHTPDYVRALKALSARR